MFKVKKNDKVLITKGKDKGKSGEVLKVITVKNGEKIFRKLVVKDLNLVKKCVKSNPGKNKTGAIIEKESPISYSNVMLLNSGSTIEGRVCFSYTEEGKKVRIFKKTKRIII